MFKIRKARQDYHNYLRFVEETMTNGKTDEAGQPEGPKMEHVNMTFVCPEGFEPAAFIITAINKNGQHYSNAPIHQPHLALRLGTLALDFVSQFAVVHIQNELQKQSPIVTAPAGSLPAWKGPEGRS